MTRRLAALLPCALMAFGQRSRPVAPPAAPAPNPWVVDAVALDASGRPVADLAAADVEVVQGGGAAGQGGRPGRADPSLVGAALQVARAPARAGRGGGVGGRGCETGELFGSPAHR